jgi:hypothetical protein
MSEQYIRENVRCDICDETECGTKVNTTPPLLICDVCLTMMDPAIALEVIGDEKTFSGRSAPTGRL